MKVVLDTNVFLSGLMIPWSVPGKIVQAWKDSRLDLVTCEAILIELKRVFTYPKIKKRLQWEEKDILSFIQLLRFKTEVTHPVGDSVPVPMDCDDTPILTAFVYSKANFLITGDSDLLALKQHYSVVTPKEFVTEQML